MNDPVAVHLLRHGAPELTGRLLGRTDSPVTPAGIAACRNAVRGLEVGAVVTSDLARARVCADEIAAGLGLTPRIDPRWRELDFGDWDGHAPATLDAAALDLFYADPDANPPPRGERWSALVARVGQALGAIDRPTLIVTHGGAMRATFAALWGFDGPQAWAFDLPYAALLSLRLWPGDPPVAQVTALSP